MYPTQVEPGVYTSYNSFCPYAYEKDKVYSHDISLNYNYQDPSTEWYATLKNRNWNKAPNAVPITEHEVTYR